MDKEHLYSLTVKWTGNTGYGTNDYRSYERSHTISSVNKAEIKASSDIAFRGDGSKYNPEELLIASISGCHMLWFLHLCAENGVKVMDYVDMPTGTMRPKMEEAGLKKLRLIPQLPLPKKKCCRLLKKITGKLMIYASLQTR